MKHLNISTKLYLGFGCVLVLAIILAAVGYVGLQSAEDTFATYRKLARQTNADGRAQANMLMTRIFAKNFVIDANRENIAGVQERTEQTLKLIQETRRLAGTDLARQVLLEDLEANLQRYVASFKKVTDLQAKRDDLVANKLNVLGPETERDLTAIMTSALEDGDAQAAYQAGITLRSLMLGRLYTNRFLIENDEASRARAIREFRDLEAHHIKLEAELQDPKRQELAARAHKTQFAYLDAFELIHQTIIERNTLIRYELDRIGPDVAARIEHLKLAIKQEQNTLGPKAEAALDRSVYVSILVSLLAIAIGMVIAGLIAIGITRPIRQLTDTAVAMGEGNLDQQITMNRSDEIGVLSKSLAAMRDAITEKVETLQQEMAERRRAEEELEETHQSLERKVEERTEELAAARDEAEQATKAKAEFLATMSHEIRTPMNGVIGMADLLQQTKMSRDQREMVETIRTSGYALLTIINDILDFSKIEAGKLDLETTPLSVGDVLEGVTETLAPNAAKKGIRLNCFVDPNIPEAVLGDPVRLRQILFNLGGNAVKFTEEGSVSLRVERIPGGGSNEVSLLFEVRDTGIGISEQAQSKLFEAFSQAESSTTRRFGGTGLGLTISQRLVELMDGEIKVQSELGKGSCFSVVFTLEVATDHQIKSDEIDVDGLNVLLALRDPFLRESLPKYLEAGGAHVAVQSDFELVESQTASAADNGKPFDVLFMENVGFKARTNTIRAIQSRANSTGTTFVLQVDHRQPDREDLSNTIYAVMNPIKQKPFLRAVAAAVGRTSPDVDYDELEIEAEAEGEVASVDEAEAAGQLILFAEDNPTNQKVMLRQLSRLGYTALVADDGEQALKALQERSFALLLTDCHMPNLDGFNLTRAIRKDEQSHGHRRMPVVAVTASALADEVTQCYEAGMDDFLSKPVEIAKLHGALKKWMPKVGNAGATPKLTDTQETAGTEQGNGPLDLSFLESNFGDDKEIINEILKEFVDPSRECCTEVSRALETESLEGVAAGTHKLKSAARTIGATDLAATCERMELASKSGDWGPVKTLAPTLNQQFEALTEYIDRL